jgi:hypothetical protein
MGTLMDYEAAAEYLRTTPRHVRWTVGSVHN